MTELFYLDLEDNYFAWAIDMNSGVLEGNPFMNNQLYGNGGVVLINCTLFRNEDFYMKALYTAYFSTKLMFFYQDLLNVLPHYKIKILPLKYNCKLFYETDEEMKNRIDTFYIREFSDKQRDNSLRYSLKEIKEEASDPVIFHYYGINKIYTISTCNKFTFQFIKYAKLSGFYEAIREKYSEPFQNCDH